MKLDWVLNEFTNAGVHAGLLSECFGLTLHLLQYDLHSRVAEDLLHLWVMHCTLPPLLGIVLTNALWNTSVCILYTCRSRIVRHSQYAHVISTGHNVRVMWQSCGDHVFTYSIIWIQFQGLVECLAGFYCVLQTQECMTFANVALNWEEDN